MVRFDIKLVSEANTREHWRKRNERKKAQQLEFMVEWRRHKPRVQLPAVITFTRYANKMMDEDNLAGAFKHVQDQLARELKIDDGDRSRVTWKYTQVQIPQVQHYFTVEWRNL